MEIIIGFVQLVKVFSHQIEENLVFTTRNRNYLFQKLFSRTFPEQSFYEKFKYISRKKEYLLQNL